MKPCSACKLSPALSIGIAMISVWHLCRWVPGTGATQRSHLFVLDVVRLVHDDDAKVEVAVARLEVAQEVVGSYEALEAAAGEVSILAAVGHMHLLLCDAQPLHQRIHPLLCTIHPLVRARWMYILKRVLLQVIRVWRQGF